MRDLGFIDLQTLLGAAHAMEVPFVFGTLTNSMRIYRKGSMTAETGAVSASMMSFCLYWGPQQGPVRRGQSGKMVTSIKSD